MKSYTRKNYRYVVRNIDTPSGIKKRLEFYYNKKSLLTCIYQSNERQETMDYYNKVFDLLKSDINFCTLYLNRDATSEYIEFIFDTLVEEFDETERRKDKRVNKFNLVNKLLNIAS